MSSEKTVFVGFRLTPEEHAKLKAMLKRSGMTFQALMKLFVNQAVSVKSEIVIEPKETSLVNGNGNGGYVQDELFGEEQDG